MFNPCVILMSDKAKNMLPSIANLVALVMGKSEIKSQVCHENYWKRYSPLKAESRYSNSWNFGDCTALSVSSEVLRWCFLHCNKPSDQRRWFPHAFNQMTGWSTQLVCMSRWGPSVCVCVCVCRWATYRRATWQFDALWTRSLLTRSPRLCCTRSSCTLRTSSSHLSVSARPRLYVHVAVSTAPRTSCCSHRRTTRRQNRSHR